jgi:heptosyltransferase-2
VFEPDKILIIRFSSLGDIILTTPFLKVLRHHYPNSQIDYLTKSSYTDIIRFNPNVNNVISVDDSLEFKELMKLRKKLSASKYNLIIDLHNNLRTFYLRTFLRISTKFIVYKKLSLRKLLLVNFKINLLKNIPAISQRYISTLRKILNLKTGSTEFLPEIFTGDITRQQLEKILNELKIPVAGRLICIVPSSKHYTKTYPAEYYVELINKFDKQKYSFILIGKGEDKENIGMIQSLTGHNVYDLCDKLDLLELAELMKKCSLVITGDTGPMHIAEAVNVPIIMLSGSSVREFGFYPQSENAVVLENNGIKCRPCSHIGRSSCPKGHFKCMKEIMPDIIFGQAKRITL